MKNTIRIFAFITLFTFTSLASAMTVNPVFNSALEFGGDTLVDIKYTDGSSSDIKAGRGLLLAGGAVFGLSEIVPNVELQTTIGFKYTGTKQASNGTVDWIRFPIEALGFYKNSALNFRVGGGLTLQVGNSLKGTQDAAVINYKVKNALGLVLQGDYFFGEKRNMSVGLRYTAISYKTDGSSTSANGNSIGLGFAFYWL